MAEKNSGNEGRTRAGGTAATTAKKEEVPQKIATFTIEELRARVDPAVYAGVCEAQRWCAGKRVTQSDFDAAVQAFTKGAVDGTS